MKRLAVIILVVVSSSLATRLISNDDAVSLFRKYVRNNLTPDERQGLDDIFQIAKAPTYLTPDLYQQWMKSTSARNINCLVCRSAFTAIFELILDGQQDEQAIQALTNLCVNLNIQDEEVCRGAVTLNIPIITHIIRSRPLATPDAFCALYLQTSTESSVCRLTDARFEWTVEIPAVPSNMDSIQPVQTDDTVSPLKVAILTDVHIDPLYEAYGVANCNEPTCCRKGQKPASRKIHSTIIINETLLERSLIQKNDQFMLNLDMAMKLREMKESSEKFVAPRDLGPAGYWGDYRSCDTPLWAFDDVIDRIAENHKDIDVVYYIGDTIDHGVWETSYDLINEMNSYMIDKIRTAFGDDVMVVPVIGNHEAQPTNQFAPSYVTGESLNTTWLYNELANKWTHYLTDEARATLREQGDFSVLVKPGFRVISINNNVAYRDNWWLVFDPEDSKRHLEFLVAELFKAEAAGEHVHILQHIPPGVADLIYTWTREYNRIVNRFSSTIKAEFNGHTHSDEFKVFYNDAGSPINVAWGAGASTTYSYYNLNYKIATFDPTTFEPINFVNYIYNLTEANLTPNRRPHWFQLYDIKQRFGLSDLTPASMDDLIHRMVTDDQSLLDLYAAFNSKLSDPRWSNCDTNCKLDVICRTSITVLWDRQKCQELIEEYYFSSK